MRFLSLFAAALIVSGCMSSSPRATVWSDDANVFSARYTSSADQLADSLVARGCVADGSRQLTCGVQGQDLAVAIQLSQPTGYSATRPDRSEATEVAGRDTDQGFEDYVSPSGERVDTVVDDEVRMPLLSRAARGSSRPRSSALLKVTAQVLDGGTPVRLGGDDAEALRESLYALLVRQLPVTKAEYYDHRMRR